MSWKFVFNTNLYALAGIHIGAVRDFVQTTGYQFFTFNGIVYDINGKDTGITTEDLY